MAVDRTTGNTIETAEKPPAPDRAPLPDESGDESEGVSPRAASRTGAAPVTADQVATLRAYLAGDFHLYERLHGQLSPTAARTGFSALLTATFFEAVDRRFAKDGTAADVVEFVGAVRARSEQLSEQLDPNAAERLIRAMLTDEDVDDIDAATKVNTQFLLLYPLVEECRLNDAGLDDLLVEARRLADEWIT